VKGDADSQIVESFPTTPIDQDNKEFYRGWLQRALLINRCTQCAAWHHPPKPVCPNCWSTDIVATEVSGNGSIYLLSLLYQGPTVAGIDYTTPHPAAVIELEEQPGLRYASTVVGIEPEAIEIGMAVELAWIDRDGAPFPVFQPRDYREAE
jgi:uncharacterized protein